MQKRLVDAASKLDMPEDRHAIFAGQMDVQKTPVEAPQIVQELTEDRTPELVQGMSLDPEEEAQTWDWFTQWETVEEFRMNLHDSVDAKQIYWLGELYEPQIKQNLLDLRAAGHTIH
ncbi:MAG: hypothetical protein L6R40_008818, partial [Gallowayella cf. fulva]